VEILMAGLLDQVRQAESGGLLTAKNPRSSAYGPYQFISGTWRDVIGRMRPDLAQLPDPQLLALRSDPELSRQAADFYMSRDITPRLQSAGFEANPANSYLGWFLGPSGAVQALKAPTASRVADVFPDIVDANANIKFRGKSFGDFTIGDLRDWSATKMAGTTQQQQESQAVFGQPEKVTVDQSATPVYSQDIGTGIRRTGNFFFPSLVDAPTPLTPEQAATQKTEMAKQATELKGLQDANSVTKGFLAMMQMGQPKEVEQEIIPNQIKGGKFVPLQMYRGLL
jgi:hypothetical protein